MASDFPPALTEEPSPGKALILFLRAVRLYLARLRMDFGFTVASTLTARTRPLCRFVFLQSKYLFPASFGFHRAACAPRLPLCGSLRLPPSVPAGSFHPARLSPCWAPWRTAPPCRVGPPDPPSAPTETPRRPPLKRPSNPARKQPSRAPNLPQPVWTHSGHSAKVCQKTGDSETFLPTPHPPGSKKVIENKDTKG